MSNPAPITLEQLFRHKRPWGQLPHQDAAIMELEEDLKANPYEVVMRRDRPWFKTWSVDGKLHDPVTLAKPLVQSFEGCHLTAYPDPGTKGEPWTIGWGSTRHADGRPVRRGETISQAQADALLVARLERDVQALASRITGWGGLSINQQAALLSFTYNCGTHWYGSEGFATLTRCLQRGLQNDAQELSKVPGALMLYVNPGGPSEAGLRRRRKAEGALWSAQ